MILELNRYNEASQKFYHIEFANSQEHAIKLAKANARGTQEAILYWIKTFNNDPASVMVYIGKSGEPEIVRIVETPCIAWNDPTIFDPPDTLDPEWCSYSFQHEPPGSFCPSRGNPPAHHFELQSPQEGTPLEAMHEAELAGLKKWYLCKHCNAWTAFRESFQTMPK